METTTDARRNQKLLEQLDNLITIRDADGNLLYSNVIQPKTLGYTAEDIAVVNARAAIHPDDFPRYQAFAAEIAQTPYATGTIEVRGLHKDGHYVWVEVTVSNQKEDPAIGGMVYNSREISERKQREADIITLNRILALLSNTNQAIVRIRDMHTLFQRICQIAVDIGGFRAAWIGTTDRMIDSARLDTQSGLTADEAQSLAKHFQGGRNSIHPSYHDLLNGDHVISNDLSDDHRKTKAGSWMRLDGAQSLGAFPLMVNSDMRGFLMLTSNEVNVFSEAQVKLLDEMAMDIGFAMEVAEQERMRNLAEASVERYAQRMEILHYIDQGISTAETVEALVKTVLGHLRRLVPCSRVAVALLDASREQMTLFAVEFDTDSVFQPGVSAPVPLHWADQFGNNERLIFDDLTSLSQPTAVQKKLVAEGMRSSLHILLKSHDQPFGVLSLISTVPGFFISEYQAIASEIGSQLAIALHQRQLDQALSDRAVELEATVESLKTAEEALRQSEARYRQVVEDQLDLICRFKPDFTITFANQAYADMFSTTADAIIGQSLMNLLSAPHSGKMRELSAEITPNHPLINVETSYRTPDGTLRWYHWKDRAVLDAAGNVIEIQAVGRDITERKLAEESEREQRRIAESIRDGLAAVFSSLDTDEVLRRILDYAAEVVPSDAGSIILFEGDTERIAYLRGFSSEMVSVYRNYQFHIAPDLHRDVIKERKPYIIGDTHASEKWVTFPETAWIRASVVTPIESHGEIIGLLCVDSAEPNHFNQRDLEMLHVFARYAALALQNAYDAEQLEQRVTQRTAELNASKEQVEIILNTSMDGILLAMPNLIIERTNLALDTMFNCTDFSCTGKSVLSLIHTSDRDRVKEAIERTITERGGQQVEVQVQRVDGSTFDAELSISAIKADDGSGTAGLVCSIQDITERKRAQLAVAEERNLLRTLIDTLPDLVWIKDKSHRFIVANNPRDPALRHMLPADPIGNDDFARWSEAEAEAFRMAEAAVMQNGSAMVDDETLFTDPDGQPLWVATTKIALHNLNGDVVGLVGSARNVTERKLREIELRYNARLQENISDAVVTTDLSFHIRGWNKAAERIYGWRADEVLGKAASQVLMTEFDTPEQSRAMRDVLFEKGHWQGEVVQHRHDGTVVYVLGSVSLLKDENGTPQGIIAVNMDITERKKTEQVLKLKAEQDLEFQQYLRELHNILLELTPIDNLDDFYRSVVEFGRSRLGFERLAVFLYDQDDNLAVGTFGTAIDGTTSSEYEVSFTPRPGGLMLRALECEERFAIDYDLVLTTGGEVNDVKGWNATSILWNGSQALGWLTADNALQHRPASKAQLDILALYSLSVGTLLARKRTEAALRESEAKFKAVMNSTSVGIMLVDEHGVIRLTNQLALDYGLQLYMTVLELGKTSLFDLNLNDREGVAQILKQVFAGNPMHVEFVHSANGREYTLDLRYDPVTTSDGTVIGAAMSFIDITDRKRAEKALAAYAEEVQDLYNQAPCGYHSLDANGLIVQINDTELNWLGYTRDEVVGKRRFNEFLTTESQIRFSTNFPVFREIGWIKDLEFDLIRKDGSIMSVILSASAIRDIEGEYLMSRTTVFDVTDRKYAEAALRESEAKFRSLVEGAPEAIIISDEAGRISLVNAEAEKVFHYTRTDMVGQTIEMLLPQARRGNHQQHRSDYLNAPRMRERGLMQGVQGQRKGGEVFYADIQLSYINTQDGLLVMAFIADITERKQAEEALRASEARYRLLADNITDLVVQVDTNGYYEYISPSIQAMLGYAPDELIGHTGYEIIHPDDLVRVNNGQLSSDANNNFGTPVTYRVRHKDGHYIWIETIGQPMHSGSASGGIMSIITTSRDVTERYAAQEALQQSEKLLREVLENLPVGVWLIAPDSTITLSNRAGTQIWSGLRTPIPGEAHWSPATGQPIDINGPVVRAITDGKASLNQIVEIESNDGTPKFLLNSAIPFHDAEEHILGAIVVNEDITLIKMAENALREAFRKEKELGELKSRFVSMASHEFRTPLATILSSAEMLLNYRERMDEPKINRKLTTIANQVKHLTDIVEDVLDLTRMQTGKTRFNPVETNLDLLSREILDEFRSRSDITQPIRYQCTPRPPVIPIDRKLVRQVLINLVSNATKYSPDDKPVFVSLEFSEETAILRVKDAGIGIPEADMHHLFEPFHRANNVGTISGTGLGLSITKQSVELHGGSIEVESQQNVGTTITVTLPLVPPQPTSQGEETQSESA